MASYNELPTREQIAAIDDVPALEDIRDEVDRAIAQIETDLEYSGRDDEWYSRARNALALHKYIGTMIDRRLRELRPKKAAPKPSSPFSSMATLKLSTRERSECSEITRAALAGDIVDPDTIPADDIEAMEAAICQIDKQLEALKTDKEDELLNCDQAAWDQQWLMRVAAALRRCGMARLVLVNRAGAIRRRQKLAVQAQRDLTRPQAFVDAAREVLDRATFLAIWDVVDRRLPLAQEVA